MRFKQLYLKSKILVQRRSSFSKSSNFSKFLYSLHTAFSYQLQKNNLLVIDSDSRNAFTLADDPLLRSGIVLNYDVL